MTSTWVEQIEWSIGSLGVFLGLFFAIFLLCSVNTQPRSSLFLGIYLLALSLRIGKSVAHHFYDLPPAPRNLFLSVLCCVGPSLWLHSKYLTLSKQNLKLVDLLHYLPFVVLLPFSWFIPNEGPASYNLLFALFYNAISFHMATYILFTVFWFFQKRHTNILPITVQKKQWLLYFLGINLLFVCFYLLVSFFLFSLYIGLSFFFSFLVFFCSFWALRHPQLFEIPVYKYQRSTLSTEEAGKIMTALTDYFQESRPYLDPSLTLSKLEEVLQIPVKHLSQAINQIEKMNYAQFVQQYRVEEAKRLLQSKAHRQWTIASIAYDSGFNSISSFNTAFKRITGLTPLTFQKSNEK